MPEAHLWPSDSIRLWLFIRKQMYDEVYEVVS